MTTTVTKRAATGTLVGLALGDALGFPTEFNDVSSILAKCGPWREMELRTPAIVSDDTQMTPGAAREGGVRRLVSVTGEQQGAGKHLSAGLLPAQGRATALAGSQPDQLQGLRRQHARRARRTRPRPQ
jgi:hypothetical protein